MVKVDIVAWFYRLENLVLGPHALFGFFNYTPSDVWDLVSALGCSGGRCGRCRCCSATYDRLEQDDETSMQ